MPPDVLINLLADLGIGGIFLWLFYADKIKTGADIEHERANTKAAREEAKECRAELRDTIARERAMILDTVPVLSSANDIIRGLLEERAGESGDA